MRRVLPARVHGLFPEGRWRPRDGLGSCSLLVLRSVVVCSGYLVVVFVVLIAMKPVPMAKGSSCDDFNIHISI